MISTVLAGICLLAISCSQVSASRPLEIVSSDTIPPPLETFIDQLPDSLRPGQSGKGIKSLSPPVARPSLPPVIHPLINHITKRPIEPEAQGKGLFTSYTTDEGLSLDQIYCGFLDGKGNLWFGTNGGGICKYDGERFVTYTTSNGLAYNLIWCIGEDADGNLWIGTDGGGVSKFDGRQFRNYTTKDGLAHNVVLSMLKDSKGNLWFGTFGGGVSKFDGKQFTNYSQSQGLGNNTVSGIAEGKNGDIWFSTRGGGVSRFNGAGFINYSVKDGLADNYVRNVFKDAKGDLWFGTNNGVSLYDGEVFRSFSTENGLVNNTVVSISGDRAGNIWIGTADGVSKYRQGQFLNYTTEQGLATDRVTSITEDSKGNIWFGTFGGGISKFSGERLVNFTTAQGLPNNVVYSITEDNTGGLWFGTNGGGASRYDGKGFANYSKDQGMLSNEIFCIAKDSKGNLWFGSSGAGASKFDGKVFTHYTTAQGLANNTVFKILEDAKGNIWFGTSGGGVSRFDGKSFTTYTTVQGLAGNVVFTIFEDRQRNLWFGTLGGGVSMFDGNRFVNYTTKQGLADNAVFAINQDSSGDIWLGTQEGLNLLRSQVLEKFQESMRKKQVFTQPLFETFTTREGLPNNFITQVVEGSGGTLYIGSNLGMCELQPVLEPTTGQKNWTVGSIYNSKTGYPIKDVNSGSGAMFIDTKGMMWIGTGSDKTGLVRFDPKSGGTLKGTAPYLQIKSIKLSNTYLSWSSLLARGRSEDKDSSIAMQRNAEEVTTFGRLLTPAERDSMGMAFKDLSFTGIGKWNPIPENLVLPHAHNNISFNFNAIETGRSQLVRYQYMLKGYDEHWSPPGSGTTASYGNMYEGRYTFMLKAQSPEGVWSEPLTYTFRVLPPWWRTWWAYAAYLVLFLWGLRMFSLYRERHLRFENEKLELKVKHRTQMLEDTIDTLKTTQAQLIQSEKMASLGELTAGIAHEIQNPLNFVNNFSELNRELIGDLHHEIEAGNINEVKEISNDLLQNLEKITHHGKRADAIVKGMLQHSRMSTGQKEPVDINGLASEYLKIAAHVIREKEEGLHPDIHTQFDASIGKISVIPQDLGRVLLNLYNNAFYALAEKRNRLGDAYLPSLSLSTRNTGGHIEIRVRDNGMGIPVDIKDKIFQPFFTTKPTGVGTGLGLSMSYDIVKAHQGTLRVESEAGVYTEFIITLPAL